jgi:hypothetical protein
MSLQRDAPLPLSQQLAALLRAEIESGRVTAADDHGYGGRAPDSDSHGGKGPQDLEA